MPALTITTIIANGAKRRAREARRIRCKFHAPEFVRAFLFHPANTARHALSLTSNLIVYAGLDDGNTQVS